MLVNYIDFVAKIIVLTLLVCLFIFIIGCIIAVVWWFITEIYVSVHNYRIERKQKNGKRN